MPQLFDLLFAPDDKWRALWQDVQPAAEAEPQQPRLDQAEALRLVGPQIKILLIAQQPGDAAVTVENACQP